MASNSTRDQIVEVADRMFYQQGYENTSFADIAESVGISRGNFYHHFKSKDDILDAVIALRLSNTQQMLDRWETEGDTPDKRIMSFIRILIVNQEKIMRFGCPVGTLCTELAKLHHAAQPDSNKLFTLFRDWLRHQFVLLGHETNADHLAMHVLARSQGVATLANAFRDEEFVRDEVGQLSQWLASLAKVPEKKSSRRRV